MCAYGALAPHDRIEGDLEVMHRNNGEEDLTERLQRLVGPTVLINRVFTVRNRVISNFSHPQHPEIVTMWSFSRNEDIRAIVQEHIEISGLIANRHLLGIRIPEVIGANNRRGNHFSRCILLSSIIMAGLCTVIRAFL